MQKSLSEDFTRNRAELVAHMSFIIIISVPSTLAGVLHAARLRSCAAVVVSPLVALVKDSTPTRVRKTLISLRSGNFLSANICNLKFWGMETS